LPQPSAEVRSITTERRQAPEPRSVRTGDAPERHGPSPAVIRATLVLLDLAALAAAVGIATYVRARAATDYPLSHHLPGLLAVPLWTMAIAHNGLYRSRYTRSRLIEARRILNAVFQFTAATALLSYALKLELSRLWLALVAILSLLFLTCERELVRRRFASLRRRGRFLERVVVVGASAEARAIIDHLEETPTLGYQVAVWVEGFDRHDEESIVDRTVEAVDAVGATCVIVASGSVAHEATNRLARILNYDGVRVELTSYFRDIASSRLLVQPLGRFAVVSVEPCRHGGWRGKAKRAFDLVVGTSILVLASPIFVVTAIAVRLDSPGSVLFRQTRVGRDGQPFRILKFRSMVVDAERTLIDLRHLNEGAGPLFKLHSDPRVTRVGRLIRKLSIDELPQLWNVLRGEMSLVGPRPALASEVNDWPEDLHHRLRVKPGITGFWQVSGRSSASFEDYARLDLYYVDNWSLFVDLAILAKTVPTLLFRRGAY
jgi:exopolysaccharide biosynthesis polyprenyl glycosylphosphotransferase